MELPADTVIRLSAQSFRFPLSEGPLRIFVHGHDHVAIVERNVGGSREPKRRPATANFLYLELHNPVMNPELECERRLAEIRVHRLDPFLESLRVEAAHVANQHGMDQLPDHFTLTLGSGMHSDHVAI